MKKGTVIIIVLAIVAVVVFWGVGAYNGLVNAEEQVNKQWANVESQYQRRADLIPNLVSTVKGYATHESQTLESVVAARAKATQVTVDPTNLTEESLKQYQEAQGELSSALGRLLMITENYPDLKANQNFLELQSQLEGTENRIQVERSRYNEEAQKYNTSVRRFPKAMIASMFGFGQKPYFAADAGAQNAPQVQF
ncbi:LemA family protein [Bacteroidales bacterium OttesenSCG-928-L03]|nr:LemA family protein [Bacteroidales bacterium OttesenSCG-928-L03]